MLSNEEFDSLLNNEEYKLISHKAVSKFTQWLDPDELHTARINGLYEAARNFDPSKGSNFKTYIYNQVTWFCKNLIREKTGKLCEFVCSSPTEFVNDNNDLTLILDSLHGEIRSIFIDRYLGNMTFREIAAKHNYSTETARKRYNQAIESIRGWCI